jgi:glycosyltransferase involved in cell wall biosynthesis
MAVLYNAADVVIVPSHQENLSNVIMESLACGTPVVAFAIGGNGDMIEHRGNGFLAKPMDPEDLAAGIRWVLEQGEPLRQRAREKVLAEFEQVKVASRYKALYEEVIGRKT